jgi:hypothetical protein
MAPTSGYQEELEAALERGHALTAQGRLEARMAQLEKVAELARQAVDSSGTPGSRTYGAYLLGLALVDLDNHSDTRTEPS